MGGMFIARCERCGPPRAKCEDTTCQFGRQDFPTPLSCAAPPTVSTPLSSGWIRSTSPRIELESGCFFLSVER